MCRDNLVVGGKRTSHLIEQTMNLSEEANEWSCSACGKALEVVKVGFTYMNGNFEVELLTCSGSVLY